MFDLKKFFKDNYILFIIIKSSANFWIQIFHLKLYTRMWKECQYKRIILSDLISSKNSCTNKQIMFKIAFKIMTLFFLKIYLTIPTISSKQIFVFNIRLVRKALSFISRNLSRRKNEDFCYSTPYNHDFHQLC